MRKIKDSTGVETREKWEFWGFLAKNQSSLRNISKVIIYLTFRLAYPILFNKCLVLGLIYCWKHSTGIKLSNISSIG